MPIVNVNTLKNYYTTGSKPTQSNYTDLIDSCYNASAATLGEPANIYNYALAGTIGLGNGVNDRAAFKLAAQANGSVYLPNNPPIGYWTLGNIACGVSGISQKLVVRGDAGLVNNFGVASATTKVKLTTGASCMFNLVSAAGAYFQDIDCDGLTRTSNTAGFTGNDIFAANCQFRNVTVRNFDTGFGTMDRLMRSPEFNNCRADANNYGYVRLLDAQVIGGTSIANRQEGLYLVSGAYSNQFSAFRVEHNQGNGIFIKDCQDNVFSSLFVDRSYKNGIRIEGALCQNNYFSGTCRRNGRNDVAGERANVYVSGTANNDFIGLQTATGNDDDGSGPLTPQYGYEFEGSPSRIRVIGGIASGTVVPMQKNWSLPTNYMFWGCDGVVNEMRGYGTKWDDQGPFFSTNNTTVSAGTQVTFSVAGLASANPQTLRSYTLNVYARNAGTAERNLANFSVLMAAESVNASASFSPSYGVVGSAGTIVFGGSAGIALSASNVANNGTSFDLIINNNTAQNQLIYYRVRP